MPYIFSKYCLLSELDLKSFNITSVKSMHSMFAFCNGIHYLDLSNFNTEKCTGFANMFYDTENITVRVSKSKRLLNVIRDLVEIETVD